MVPLFFWGEDSKGEENSALHRGMRVREAMGGLRGLVQGQGSRDGVRGEERSAHHDGRGESHRERQSEKEEVERYFPGLHHTLSYCNSGASPFISYKLDIARYLERAPPVREVTTLPPLSCLWGHPGLWCGTCAAGQPLIRRSVFFSVGWSMLELKRGFDLLRYRFMPSKAGLERACAGADM